MGFIWMVIFLIISIYVATKILHWDGIIKNESKLDFFTKFLLRSFLWSTAIVGTIIIMIGVRILRGGK